MRRLYAELRDRKLADEFRLGSYPRLATFLRRDLRQDHVNED